MRLSSKYAPQLRSLGFRVTLQRMAILRVLEEAPGHLSPKQVYIRARRALPGITPTTVYRTLEFLIGAGLVWPSSRAGGHLAYELAQARHHHLVCRNCGRESVLQPGVLEAAYRKLETASGYAIDDEHVTLSGLCPKCQKTSLRSNGLL